MRPKISLVDLGLGNLRSVSRAFERAGADVQIVRDAAGVARAERLVVPGQGAFATAVEALGGGVREALLERLDAGVPYFGICLGMQLLFEGSEESPGASGLGRLAGQVRRFSDELRGPSGERLKVPHMGWNEVRGRHPLLEARAYFYFVHSYYCVPEDTSLIVGEADHGGPLCAAIARGPLFACQFHPEKSHHAGAALLRRFLETSWS